MLNLTYLSLVLHRLCRTKLMIAYLVHVCSVLLMMAVMDTVETSGNCCDGPRPNTPDEFNNFDSSGCGSFNFFN